MAMRYCRYLNPEFEALLTESGALRFLVDEVKKPTFRDFGIPLDLQFRENNEVTLYLGLTKLVTITLVQTRPVRLRLNAHNVYRLADYGLGGDHPLDNTSHVRDGLERYLASVCVNPRHYRREGGTQNTMSHMLGVKWQVGQPLMVDREVVIGYDDQSEKDASCHPIQELANRIGCSLLEKDRARFGGKIEEAGGELDCLLWKPSSHELLITEVKHASGPRGARGVYLSPRQVACYHAEWARFIQKQPDQALAGIRMLVEQKQRLGLLPAQVRPPTSPTDLQLRPAIVIECPNWRSSCWESLKTVHAETTKERWEPYCGEGKKILADLVVYEWDRTKGLTDITEEVLCN